MTQLQHTKEAFSHRHKRATGNALAPLITFTISKRGDEEAQQAHRDDEPVRLAPIPVHALVVAGQLAVRAVARCGCGPNDDAVDAARAQQLRQVIGGAVGAAVVADRDALDTCGVRAYA